MWLDALSQNAWDTGASLFPDLRTAKLLYLWFCALGARFIIVFYVGAGVGTFLTYATYMKRTQGAVKLGTITPFFNNIVR